MSLYDQVKRINEAEYTINRLIYKHYMQYLNSGITTQQAVVLDIVYVANRITESAERKNPLMLIFLLIFNDSILMNASFLFCSTK